MGRGCQRVPSEVSREYREGVKGCRGRSVGSPDGGPEGDSKRVEGGP